MNNDGNDCVIVYNQFNTTSTDSSRFLQHRTSEIINSQIDSYFYCTGVFNLYQHNSQVTEFLKGIDNNCAEQLVNQGTDVLEIVSNYCLENEKEIFWSMRMNDTHDSSDPSLMSNWKRSNKRLIMSSSKRHYPFGGGRWSALNYEKKEVHQKVLEIIEDVVSRYSLHGIELDFFRHPIFFPEQLVGDRVRFDQREKMSDLIYNIRGILDKYVSPEGGPLLLAIRIPDSIAFNYAIGLDIVDWVCNSWIDLIIGGGYFQLEPWDNLSKFGEDYNVPVYACLSASRLGYNPENWRHHAIDALKADVDGIYTFNLFGAQHPLFKEIGSLDTMKNTKSKNIRSGDSYLINYWLNNGISFKKT